MAERWTAEGGPDEKTACGRGDRGGAVRLRGDEQVAGASGVASDLAVPPLGLGLAGDADRAVPTPQCLAEHERMGFVTVSDGAVKAAVQTRCGEYWPGDIARGGVPSRGENKKWRILPVGEVNDQRAACQGGYRRNAPWAGVSGSGLAYQRLRQSRWLN